MEGGHWHKSPPPFLHQLGNRIDCESYPGKDKPNTTVWAPGSARATETVESAEAGGPGVYKLPQPDPYPLSQSNFEANVRPAAAVSDWIGLRAKCVHRISRPPSRLSEFEGRRPDRGKQQRHKVKPLTQMGKNMKVKCMDAIMMVEVA